MWLQVDCYVSGVTKPQQLFQWLLATIATATEKPEKKPDVPAKEQKVQRSRADDKFKIFCGTANGQPAEICAFLGMERGKATVMISRRWQDLHTNHGKRTRLRCFVVQPDHFPVDEHLLELLLLVDALKRASANASLL